MHGTGEKSKNSGVSCAVKTCEYHTHGDACMAPVINVGNDVATEARETCCDTFRCRSDAK